MLRELDKKTKGVESGLIADNKPEALPKVDFPDVVIDSPQITPVNNSSSSAVVSSSAQNSNASAAHAKLINSNPSEKLMQTEVKNELNSQLRVLRKKEGRLSKNAKKYSMELSDVWKEIRRINRIILELALLSYDKLKKLWLEVIHKIVLS